MSEKIKLAKCIICGSEWNTDKPMHLNGQFKCHRCVPDEFLEYKANTLPTILNGLWASGRFNARDSDGVLNIAFDQVEKAIQRLYLMQE